MNILDPSSASPANPDWQVLGEFQIPFGPNIADLLLSRLTDILKPLDLQLDFVSRLQNSAQDAIERALGSNAESLFEQIHLSILVPSKRALHGHSWGYFRIDKFGSADPEKKTLVYAVEFYLYLDGQ